MEFFDPGRDMGSTRGDENDSAEVEGDEEDNGGCAVVAAADDAGGCGGGDVTRRAGTGGGCISRAGLYETAGDEVPGGCTSFTRLPAWYGGVSALGVDALFSTYDGEEAPLGVRASSWAGSRSVPLSAFSSDAAGMRGLIQRNLRGEGSGGRDASRRTVCGPVEGAGGAGEADGKVSIAAADTGVAFTVGVYVSGV